MMMIIDDYDDSD